MSPVAIAALLNQTVLADGRIVVVCHLMTVFERELGERLHRKCCHEEHEYFPFHYHYFYNSAAKVRQFTGSFIIL
jgi:hypothetical protein